MFRCDAIVVILGCYYSSLVSRSERISSELSAKTMQTSAMKARFQIAECRFSYAKLMNYHQKMQEIQRIFVTLHPNLGNLNKSVWLPQAFRKDFAP